jgi:hypothetical protein
VFSKPPSGGFPEGLLDRAFYARGASVTDLKARFNGLCLKAFGLMLMRNFKAR